MVFKKKKIDLEGQQAGIAPSTEVDKTSSVQYPYWVISHFGLASVACFPQPVTPLKRQFPKTEVTHGTDTCQTR